MGISNQSSQVFGVSRGRISAKPSQVGGRGAGVSERSDASGLIMPYRGLEVVVAATYGDSCVGSRP